MGYVVGVIVAATSIICCIEKKSWKNTSYAALKSQLTRKDTCKNTRLYTRSKPEITG